jgi:hypothetical protein
MYGEATACLTCDTECEQGSYMKKMGLQLSFFLFLLPLTLFAKDYVIYSVAHDLPLSNEEKPKAKNYYINMGSVQGLKKGALRDVYRSVMKTDPYETKKKFNYRMKIGELKVIHSESEAAVAVLNKLEEEEDAPIIDVEALMIGDAVEIKVR